MFQALQIATILLVAGAMTPALAHALGYPGKLALGKDAYVTTQQIYYPGFTIIGGGAEVLAVAATLLLAIVTPKGTISSWLTFGAFIAMVCMHAVYWVFTHPANKYWLKDAQVEASGRRFFAFDPFARADRGAPEWIVLRDRWEISHMVRAVLSVLALGMLAAAVVLNN